MGEKEEVFEHTLILKEKKGGVGSFLGAAWHAPWLTNQVTHSVYDPHNEKLSSLDRGDCFNTYVVGKITGRSRETRGTRRAVAREPPQHGSLRNSEESNS